MRLKTCCAAPVFDHLGSRLDYERYTGNLVRIPVMLVQVCQTAQPVFCTPSGPYRDKEGSE